MNVGKPRKCADDKEKNARIRKRNTEDGVERWLVVWRGDVTSLFFDDAFSCEAAKKPHCVRQTLVSHLLAE